MNDREMDACIEECTRCHQTCVRTLRHCLEMGGPHAEAGHVRLMMDCVQICQTSADFMLRGSELHIHTCRACAEVCDRCAQDCARMSDDEPMRRCADACRRCAERCRHMAGAAA